MKKLKNLFCGKEFSLFLFFLCFVLFSWPFLATGLDREHIFAFLFITWAFIALVLFFMAKNNEKSCTDKDSKTGDDGNV
ncbi:MAG: hypothetical protein PHN57_08295 [Candidatus Omnitrophica bacterium]|nr:hypothetical protein [Candidatus Omnitrophota bacterium]